jgi:pimeloyl-ACP methyl ester carboxylesterase
MIAVRKDSAGFYEEVQYLGEGERVFSTLHHPVGQPCAGVVICPPISSDFMVNYRREVELGRALASMGVAVLRFHYRGTGNSDGDPSVATFDTFCEDARFVADYLRSRIGQVPLGVLGTRLGALVAAPLAASLPICPLVLWEPALDAAAYYREGLRATLIRESAEGRAAVGPQEAFVADLRDRGMADVLGYPIYRSFYESTSSLKLSNLMDSRPHPLLVVGFKAGRAPTPPQQKLQDALTSQGYEVCAEEVDLAVSWWFHSEDAVTCRPLIELTSAWLESQLSSAAPPAARNSMS